MNKAILFTLLFAAAALFGFKQYEQGTAKETMTIMAVNRNYKDMTIYLSGSNQAFQTKQVKAEHKKDYTEVMKLVSEYQNNGWQIKSSNFTAIPPSANDPTQTLYFLLEK
ncbi:hypothetical protein H8S95_13445 [Pontibacter sp. KCTC 32443]|uniref:hypothetical protein n=1 Tax=Pontibacter TaxID=323449 RepID=UPI00164E92A0|nr:MULTISPECIES: hypothetical protein [Pontibacter]MBC5775076.1 hypothetical protein [Pontibacter sp. KCTC 32443]